MLSPEIAVQAVDWLAQGAPFAPRRCRAAAAAPTPWRDALSDAGAAAAWEELAAAAADRNAYFEPWALCPAVRYLGGGRAVEVKLAEEGGRAYGLVPLVPLGAAPVAGGAIWSVWSHPHCFDATPLVRAGEEQRFLDALFGMLADRRALLLRWPSLPLDTGFARALLAFLGRTGRAWRMTEGRQRPLLRLGGCNPGDLESIVPRKRLREVNRCRRRLEETGRVAFRELTGRHDASDWCEDFLPLEANGWKGPRGTATALACRPAEQAFFRAMCGHAAAAGRAIVHSLELDGRPIAMSVNLRAGDGAWAYKTAYDERLARHSPGVLLEIESMRALSADLAIQWVDSCTADAAGLMGGLWPDRREIADLLVAVAPAANVLVPVAARVEMGRRRLRRSAGAALRGLQRWRARSPERGR